MFFLICIKHLHFDYFFLFFTNTEKLQTKEQRRTFILLPHNKKRKIFFFCLFIKEK